FDYDSDLFEPATIARMAGHFINLAQAALERPRERIDRLQLIDDRERAAILAASRGPRTDVPEHCIHQLFEEWARRTPEAVAVELGDSRLSYAALDAEADALACELQALGVGPDVPIALCVDRSPALIVAVLGILKAGGAFVPLDPAYP